ncbi:MAG: DUF2934 domain-containing protein [Candidatus Omnitrophica bacterium]|nr:DUF2934 domain-containing protein [Candidatus Omnitrophota bacterium]MCB9719963.1 DUF2934 domain-containing protein [Candidatus Omnitrophota bacterium]
MENLKNKTKMAPGASVKSRPEVKTIQKKASTAIEASRLVRIQQKAFELFEKRGCIHGHADEDWYEAEKMVAPK